MGGRKENHEKMKGKRIENHGKMKGGRIENRGKGAERKEDQIKE